MPINKAVLAAMKTMSRLKPDARKAYRLQRIVEGVSARLAQPDPRCRIDRIHAVMPDGFRLPLFIFTPLGVDGGPDGSAGTVVFIHGGGWVSGSAELYVDSCTATALELNRRVISVDYRLAPEYRFPQAAEDCYEVVRQLFAGTLLPGTDLDRIVLFGDSAGGNLTAVVSLMARDRGEFMPRTQMLLYPVVNNDYGPSSPFESVRTNGKDYLLTAQDMADYLDMYRSSPEDLTNPYFAPLLAADFSDQPRTLVMTAEYCPLRDEGEAYAACLAQAGNDVRCFRVLNGVHGYFLYPSVFNLVADTYRIIRHVLDGAELEQEGDAAWVEIGIG